MTYVYKGQGLYQTTGKQTMSQSGMYAANSSVAALGSGTVTIGNPIPPLTIQSLSNYSNHGHLTNLNNVFINGADRNMSSDVKKYEVYESPEDILALSVAWRRLRKNGLPLSISSLLERQVFERLTPEDREKANSIRDYYSKKIMMWKLKGKELTSFRKDLNTFVHEEGTKFKEGMIGLAYYLPEFYEYDIELDSVREKVSAKLRVSYTERTLMPLASLMEPCSKKLTPIKRINRVTKRVNHVQYWFKDTVTDAAVLISIDSKNPLEHVWNDMFDNSASLTISGKFYVTDREDFEHFSIKNWKLAKI